MRSFLLTGLLTSFLVFDCLAQSEKTIVDYYQHARFLDPQDFLFTISELIELCVDSAGRQKFTATIEGAKKSIELNESGQALEVNLLLSMVKARASEVKTQSPVEQRALDFILTNLQPFNIDAPVSEAYVAKRFSIEGDLTFCTECSSMYLILLHDPQLYVKVRSKEPDFVASSVHFPVAYILQDCNKPIELMGKIQTGLLSVLKGSEGVLLKEIYAEIEGCDLTNRCD